MDSTGSGHGTSATPHGNSNFHKQHGIYWPAKQLPASPELCATALIIKRQTGWKAARILKLSSKWGMSGQLHAPVSTIGSSVRSKDGNITSHSLIYSPADQEDRFQYRHTTQT
jgi:hypothetical protein